jgi:hypothetical protein
MPIHNINIRSKSDCQELIARIRGTLSAVKPHALTQIGDSPAPFRRDDTHMFGCLTEAVLSNGTKSELLTPHLSEIKRILFNYNVALIAGLSNSAINTLYLSQIKPLRIPSRQKLERQLLRTRDNANKFLYIQEHHGSVWHFIETSLGGMPLDNNYRCYIHPKDDALLKSFSSGPLKLKGVGLPICCEFLNNIGIDEFKPDVHTTRFLNNRIRVAPGHKPTDIRRTGIAIAETLAMPRKYVDNHIWVFCAAAGVCTDKNPKCHSCWLNIKQPRLCHVPALAV